MDSESPATPISETLAAPRIPLHLRYFSILRTNKDFRRLWLAQLISEIGDWFYSLAVYDLLHEATHSGKAVGWAIIIQLLPWFIMTPLSGALADRFPRRQLMIVADVVRGLVVLGLLLARTASDVWLVYALLGAEVIFASIFEPARNALLPNLVRAEEVLPANALSSATWSLALTAGAAVGGAVTALFGRKVAFVVNSLSFFASALLIQQIKTPETHLQAASRAAEAASEQPSENSWREGWEYLRQNPRVVVLLMAKSGLGFVGASLLLLAVFGERIFPVAGHGALAMGLLFAARGVGAGIGPMVGDHLMRGREERMWRSLSLSFFVMSAAYLALSRAPNLPLAALAVFCGHMGGSNIWVVSTSLLQLHVADRFRGRVFALDFGLLSLTASASIYLVGVGLDTWQLSARQISLALGAMFLIPALIWLPTQARWAAGRQEALSSRQ